MKSDRAVRDFFKEYAGHYKRIADREWQRAYDKGTSTERVHLLMLKEAEKFLAGMLRQEFTHGTGFFSNDPQVLSGKFGFTEEPLTPEKKP